jgi:chromate transporter
MLSERCKVPKADQNPIAHEPNVCQGTPRLSVSFWEAFQLWVHIALNSFSGPEGQIAVMYRCLVEEKRWIGESRFLHALNYCMLLPGPDNVCFHEAAYFSKSAAVTFGGAYAVTAYVGRQPVETFGGSCRP